MPEPSPVPDPGERLAALCRGYARSGASPATSGNYSVRLAPDRVLITPSGIDKAGARARDLLTVDLDGTPVAGPPGARPSAETRLHLALYQRDPGIGAVLHTHSLDAVALAEAVDGAPLVLRGRELLKAFPGPVTHERAVVLPVVGNDQDMDRLARVADGALGALAEPTWGYVIRGHGLYAWGASLDEAARHVEAFQYLLALEWRLFATGAARRP